MVTPVVRPGQANVVATGIGAIIGTIVPLIVLALIASIVRRLTEGLGLGEEQGS